MTRTFKKSYAGIPGTVTITTSEQKQPVPGFIRDRVGAFALSLIKEAEMKEAAGRQEGQA